MLCGGCTPPAMNFQAYPGGGNPLGFGFGKTYGGDQGETSPMRRLRRPPCVRAPRRVVARISPLIAPHLSYPPLPFNCSGIVRLPPMQDGGGAGGRSLTPPHGRSFSGPAPSPMRPGGLSSSQLLAPLAHAGGASLDASRSLDSSFTSAGLNASALSASGFAPGGGDLASHVLRLVDARLAGEASARDSMAREVHKLREAVHFLERERDEARGAAEALRSRQSHMAAEVGLLRDRLELAGAGGGPGGSGKGAAAAAAAAAAHTSEATAAELRMARADVAGLAARLEGLARDVHGVAREAGSGADAAARAAQSAQRDVLALVESEMRGRHAAEEALNARVLGLQRALTEAVATANSAASAAGEARAAAEALKARSPRRRGAFGGLGEGGDGDENALDVRTVVTKPILETYLSGLRHALEAEAGGRRGDVARLEAQLSSALDRVGAQVGGIKAGIQAELTDRVESVVAAVTGAVTDLSARSREHAGALSDHAASLAGLAGGLEVRGRNKSPLSYTLSVPKWFFLVGRARHSVTRAPLPPHLSPLPGPLFRRRTARPRARRWRRCARPFRGAPTARTRRSTRR